jgi:surface protein
MALSTQLREATLSEQRLILREIVTKVVFTDHPAPSNAEIYDVSEAQDGGVVCWVEDKTMHFSTQREGIKVVAPVNAYHLFQGFRSMQTIDGSMLDTSHAVDMRGMFRGCWALENADGLATWDVSNVKRMDGMFAYCEALTNINGLRTWDVSNVEQTNGMFENCDSLEHLDGLALWNMSHAQNISYMFYNCNALQNIDGLAIWNTINVQHMEGMFESCPRLWKPIRPQWYQD